MYAECYRLDLLIGMESPSLFRQSGLPWYADLFVIEFCPLTTTMLLVVNSTVDALPFGRAGPTLVVGKCVT